MITHTQLMDLEEMTDPNYDGIPGSNMDLFGPWEQDDIEQCNKNMKFVFDCEELAQEETSMILFGELPDPCYDRKCSECEIGGCVGRVN